MSLRLTAAALLLTACARAGSGLVTVTLDGPAGVVSDAFISLAIDSAHLTGGEFWAPGGDEIELRSGTHRAVPLDFRDEKLRRFAASPRRWRPVTCGSAARRPTT